MSGSFRHPADKATVLVKRVVGLPGDHVQMRQGRLVINGRMLDLIAAGMGEAESQQGDKSAIHQFVEVLPNGVRHPVFKRRWRGVLDNTGIVAVPPGHLFVMGDTGTIPPIAASMSRTAAWAWSPPPI